MSALKVGVIRLGRAAGKVKHALLDEDDIHFVEEFVFEARVEVDPNGHGARIYAWCYNMHRGRSSGQYVHNMLWEKHRGGIAPAWKVVHRNGITVDNRKENLTLVLKNKPFVPEKEEKSHKEKREESLYYLAIAQLPADPLQELIAFPETYYNRYYNANGEVIDEQDDSNMYYECHYPPCMEIECEMRQFSICGRCQHVRYCGVACQQKDWAAHKRFCREKRRSDVDAIDPVPDR